MAFKGARPPEMLQSMSGAAHRHQIAMVVAASPATLNVAPFNLAPAGVKDIPPEQAWLRMNPRHVGRVAPRVESLALLPMLRFRHGAHSGAPRKAAGAGSCGHPFDTWVSRSLSWARIESSVALWPSRRKRSASDFAAPTCAPLNPHPGQSLIRCAVSSPHVRSEEHTSELQSRLHLVCRLLLEKKKKHTKISADTPHL